MEHSEIEKRLSGQLQELLKAYPSTLGEVGLVNDEAISRDCRPAVETTSQRLGNSLDISDATTKMQLDSFGARSFLIFAKYVVGVYSNRLLTVEQFSGCSSRPFSWISKLVNDYMLEVDRGAPNPFREN